MSFLWARPGSGAGIVHDDLQHACLEALKLRPEDAVKHAKNYNWEAVTNVFFDLLTPHYKPRKRWRRVRRVTRLAASPYHSLKKLIRRIFQSLRGRR